MSAMRRCLAIALIACATAAATTAFVPVARSALVTLEAARTPAGLTLRAARVSGAQPLSGAGMSVSIDGHTVAARANADGSWSTPWPAGDAAGGKDLQVVLAHDGIREVLSGPLPAALGAPAAPAGLFGNHKQMVWWVLNIAIVLIAVMALSRRMS
jgi:hypothetical protein